ncbi:CopG family ribbon-helix-helix protein [Hyperthermus butylicus]|uniref:Conserved crenarchaeal protein n=1 Tax=Hyperthermus butylicus (strain DSM 5456 / JCM 9403 / PLM1-5) TaxID=415426 RepID=A2BMU8_HYPBU|nr:ribbon-helix-helix domain-containing protein [Hyperthermus butylicus]ABM81309.1 conserved crenarchaeal protein [Hyperthermus butylicus DSM 5456]
MKRRFGISINESIAKMLEVLSNQTGVNRSRLIEEAIKGYLEDHSHLLVPHDCKGILVAHCPASGQLSNITEEYSEVIVAWLHAHLNEACMEAFFAEGESRKIMGLYSEILKRGCKGRYIPVGNVPP